MMAEDGVLAVILPEVRRHDRLQRLIAIEQVSAIEPEPDALRRLAALIDVDAKGAVALAERLRFSNVCATGCGIWRHLGQSIPKPIILPSAGHFIGSAPAATATSLFCRRPTG